MARLRIYGIARTRAFRVLWMAEELGLDYEHIAIETGPAGARQPGYLAVNPNGRLPAIDNDGFIMWESLAINIYLAKKHAAGSLYPATPQGEAKARNGACGRQMRSSARPMSGRSMLSGCQRPNATRRSPRRRSNSSRRRSACSTEHWPTSPICSAARSPWPTSMSRRLPCGRSRWIYRRRRITATGYNAAITARRRRKYRGCARRPRLARLSTPSEKQQKGTNFSQQSAPYVAELS